MKLKSLVAINMIMGCALVGCAQSRYLYGVREHISYQPPDNAQPTNPMAVGGYHPRIDRLESFVEAPQRFIEKHIPRKKEETEEKPPEQLRAEAISLSQEYLKDNNLQDVYIDVQRYEPGEQWARLRANDRISPVWKYTGGSLNVIVYSLIPGRAFHQDRYDPFTNTLSLNSTNPLDALYEAGSAKEYHKHERLGTYSMAQYIPFATLGHDWRVTSDVITYAQAKELWEVEKELYPYTYSNWTSSAVSEALSLYPVGSATQIVLGMAGEGAGKLAGNAVARDAEAQRNNVSQPGSSFN